MNLTLSQETAKKQIIQNPHVIISGDRQVGKSHLILDIASSWNLNKIIMEIDHLYVMCHNYSTVQDMRNRFDCMTDQPVREERLQSGIVSISSILSTQRPVIFETIEYFSNRFVSFRALNHESNRIGVIVDEAAFTNKSSFLESVAKDPRVAKFIMISSPGPGQFFSEILNTCLNTPAWVSPLFKHHELESTAEDKMYFSNAMNCPEPKEELLELFNQQQEINRQIQQIILKQTTYPNV